MKILAQILLFIMQIILCNFETKSKDRLQTMFYQLEEFLIFLVMMILISL